MRLNARRALTEVLSIVVCASALLMSSRQPLSAIDTTDPNGQFDVHSASSALELASVAVDTNLDGRSDVQEFYDRGALVRRESDRDFNDQIDLVQEFDPATRQIVRSVTDVNADGIADLLVLFQNGRPVYSKWIQSASSTSLIPRAPVERQAAPNSPLAPLIDPFSADLALKAARVVSVSVRSVGLSTSGGLPETPISVERLISSPAAEPADQLVGAQSTAGPSSLRGPPPVQSLT